MAVNGDLELFRSSDTVFTVAVKEDGGPADVTGWTFQLVAKARSDDDTAVLTLSTGSGIAITDAVNGEIELTIDTEASNVSPGRYPYTLCRTNAGAKTVLRYGDLVVYPNPAF